MKSMRLLLCWMVLIILMERQSEAKGPDGKCRVIVFRGGGTKGAYEAGAFKTFTELLDPIEVQYDVVAGVSIGALTASLLATHPKGEEISAIDEILELWTTHGPQNFWAWWPWYQYASLLVASSSIFDASPLYKEIGIHIGNKQLYRKIVTQSVDLSSGKVVLFDENVPLDKRVAAMTSSASIPVAFQPVLIDQYVLADGGLFTNLDLGAAINRCREEVEDSNIIVDVLMCSDQPAKIPEWTKDELFTKKTYSYIQRGQDFKDYYYYMEDIIREVTGYHEVNFRYMVTPSKTLPSAFVPIFASPEEIQYQVELGKQDAKTVISNGEGYEFRKLLSLYDDEWDHI